MVGIMVGIGVDKLILEHIVHEVVIPKYTRHFSRPLIWLLLASTLAER
jgi:hypothetical protein